MSKIKKDCTPMEEAIAQELFDSFETLVCHTDAYAESHDIPVLKNVKNLLHDLIHEEDS